MKVAVTLAQFLVNAFLKSWLRRKVHLIALLTFRGGEHPADVWRCVYCEIAPDLLFLLSLRVRTMSSHSGGSSSRSKLSAILQAIVQEVDVAGKAGIWQAILIGWLAKILALLTMVASHVRCCAAMLEGAGSVPSHGDHILMGAKCIEHMRC